MIDKPGKYNLSDSEYHSNPCPEISLSASGIKQLIEFADGKIDGCPAQFKYWLDNPSESNDAFDFGKVAHAVLLGTGGDYEIVDAADKRKNSTKDLISQIRSDGKTPIMIGDFEKIAAMKEAAYNAPIDRVSGATVADLLSGGEAEQTIIWHDEVWCRAKPDYICAAGLDIVVDYKTCNKASRSAARKAMDSYGYYIQAYFYLEGLRALGLAGDNTRFLFLFQEKNPPYITSVYAPNLAMLNNGWLAVRKAKETLKKCLATNEWPGYTESIVELEPTRFSQYAIDEEEGEI